MLPDQVLRQLHWIDARAAGNVAAQAEWPGPQQGERFVIRNLMEEAITSSQLEGAATTRKVALEMLRQGRKPRGKDELMIRNNWLAMQRIKAQTGQPVSAGLVLELHRILTEGTLDSPDAAGRLQRPDEERVHVYDHLAHQVLHAPPPAEQLEERMQGLVGFANGELDAGAFVHPVIRAIIVHFMCAYDHPFEDGNGRTARALFYWCMLNQGYRLFEYISISRLLRRAPGQYSRAFLHTETDGNDLTYFILQQLDVITQAIEDLDQWIERKSRELKQVQGTIRDAEGLNQRQKELLVHAIKNPSQVYTVSSQQQSHGVAYATARADLLGLAAGGWLRKIREGKPMEFTPTTKLQERAAKQ
jgi:Fic family protein